MHARLKLGFVGAAVALQLAGCAQLPTSGPRTQEILAANEAPAATPGTEVIQIVDVDDRVARQLLAQKQPVSFRDSLGESGAPEPGVGPGDGLEISIWEVPPATLFAAGGADPVGSPSTVRPMTMPEQIVDRDGTISVPFAGRIKVAGKTPLAIGDEIAQRLKGKANHPEVVVRQTRNVSSIATVVGEVTTSVRLPLTASGERLLDAIAAAGGVRQPVGKTTVQVTRGDRYYALPLDDVIRDPRQNIPLRGGDVITAMYQPFSVTVLGATGRNDELNFEAQGITLAQALARAGGLLDSRSNPEGVFVFRFEKSHMLDWPRQPVATTPDGLVPVVYRVNMRDPRTFFTIQNFDIRNKDILYVSNAPAAELQKFLNLIFSVTFPVVNLVNATR